MLNILCFLNRHSWEYFVTLTGSAARQCTHCGYAQYQLKDTGEWW